MTTVNNTTSSVLDNLSVNNKTKGTKSNELGRDAFLELMVAQLNNQDPLSPQENGEFVAQLAQFSSVEGIQQMNDSLESFASAFNAGQALQVSSLVGRSVLVPGEDAVLEEGRKINGVMELPSSTSNVSLSIYDKNDQLVYRRELGAQEAGDLSFSWDGIDEHGNQVSPGNYRIQARAMIDGESADIPTQVGANVNSVTLGGGKGPVLNVAGVGPVLLSDVKGFL